MPSTALPSFIGEAIAARGRITVAEFMELALYHPLHGYYASKARRSGRGGDFYTSVDAGPLFGACLARYLAAQSPNHQITKSHDQSSPFDLVEAGAGNGQLARDILDTAEREAPDFYARIRLYLVERSSAARAVHLAMLGPHAGKLVYSGDTLPKVVRGAIVANEVLDALPCHLVVMTERGPCEAYVADGKPPFSGSYVLETGELSDRAIATQLEHAGARLETGWRAEVSLAARRWVTDASRALVSGQLLIFDYGYEADELYSHARAQGTLARYSDHRIDERWMDDAGACDLTAHVDFTTVRDAAAREGLQLQRFTDQTRFLLDCGITTDLSAGASAADVRRRLAARTLLAPDGLGGTIQVMVLRRPEA